MRVWRRPHDRPAAVPRRGLTRSINGRAPPKGFPHAAPHTANTISLTPSGAASPPETALRLPFAGAGIYSKARPGQAAWIRGSFGGIAVDSILTPRPRVRDRLVHGDGRGARLHDGPGHGGIRQRHSQPDQAHDHPVPGKHLVRPLPRNLRQRLERPPRGRQNKLPPTPIDPGPLLTPPTSRP